MQSTPTPEIEWQECSLDIYATEHLLLTGTGVDEGLPLIACPGCASTYQARQMLGDIDVIEVRIPDEDFPWQAASVRTNEVGQRCDICAAGGEYAVVGESGEWSYERPDDEDDDEDDEPPTTTKLHWSPWPYSGALAPCGRSAEIALRHGSHLSLDVFGDEHRASWSVTYYTSADAEPAEGSASASGHAESLAKAKEAAEMVAEMVRDALCAEPATPARHIRQRIYLVSGTLAVIGIDGDKVHTIALITVTPEIITDLRSIVTELNFDEQARLLGY